DRGTNTISHAAPFPRRALQARATGALPVLATFKPPNRPFSLERAWRRGRAGLRTGDAGQPGVDRPVGHVRLEGVVLDRFHGPVMGEGLVDLRLRHAARAVAPFVSLAPTQHEVAPAGLEHGVEVAREHRTLLVLERVEQAHVDDGVEGPAELGDAQRI